MIEKTQTGKIVLRDDVSVLYSYLGRPSQSYLDFQTEDDFRERVNAIVSRRSAVARMRMAKPPRPLKIVGIISIGDLYSRKLVASLAAVATQRLKGKQPVQVVDLIPVDHNHEERSFLLSSGIRHVMIDASEQSVRMESAKEIAWLEQRIAEGSSGGMIFVDVPESVMHVRRHAMAAADMLLVLIPATLGAVRAIEEIEAELSETVSSGLEGGVHYLLVESSSFECLSPLLMDELKSHAELLVSTDLKKEDIPSFTSVSASRLDAAQEFKPLVDISNFILGKLVK